MTQPPRKRILLVDDDNAVHSLVTKLLESQGYDIETAANGREGLALLEKLHSQLGMILLDLQMPIMGGSEFLQTLRSKENWTDIPVVVCSSDGEQAKPASANSFLAKPVEPTQLLTLTARYCR